MGRNWVKTQLAGACNYTPSSFYFKVVRVWVIGHFNLENVKARSNPGLPKHGFDRNLFKKPGTNYCTLEGLDVETVI